MNHNVKYVSLYQDNSNSSQDKNFALPTFPRRQNSSMKVDSPLSRLQSSNAVTPTILRCRSAVARTSCSQRGVGGPTAPSHQQSPVFSELWLGCCRAGPAQAIISGLNGPGLLFHFWPTLSTRGSNKIKSAGMTPSTILLELIIECIN